jgi:hypothetical protein
MPAHDGYETVGACQAKGSAPSPIKSEDIPDTKSSESLSPRSKLLPRSTPLHSKMTLGGLWCDDGPSLSSLPAQEAGGSTCCSTCGSTCGSTCTNQAAQGKLESAFSSINSSLTSLESRFEDLDRAVSNLQCSETEQHQGAAPGEGSTLQERMAHVHIRLHSLEARASVGPSAASLGPKTPRRTLDSQPSVLGTSRMPSTPVRARANTRTSVELSRHMSSGFFDVMSIMSASIPERPADPAPASDAAAKAGLEANLQKASKLFAPTCLTAQEEPLDLDPRASNVEAKHSDAPLLTISANHSNEIEYRQYGAPGTSKCYAPIGNDWFAICRMLGTGRP